MPTDTNERTERQWNRREALHALGAAGALGVFGTGTTAARGRGNGGGPPNGGGNGRGPPQKCECPEDSFLAKYDFVTDDDDCYFELAEGEDVINITDWESKEGEDCEPITVFYTAEGYRIDAVCAFGGTDTDTVEDPDGTFESDLTNPGGQQAAISNLTFCGEEEEEVEVECPELSGEYLCTLYQEETDAFVRTGTRFSVTNTGPVPAVFDLAVANDPSAFREALAIGEETSRTVVTDASVPQQAVVVWNLPEGCEADETWGEYKARVGVDDLTDWFNTFGTTSPPFNAPADFDDDRAVAVASVPEMDATPAETVGPDGSIPLAQYPDMSAEAEAEGWITCAKEQAD